MPIKSARLNSRWIWHTVKGYLTRLLVSSIFFIGTRERTPLLGGVNRDVQKMIGFQICKDELGRTSSQGPTECHREQINECLNYRELFPVR